MFKMKNLLLFEYIAPPMAALFSSKVQCLRKRRTALHLSITGLFGKDSAWKCPCSEIDPPSLVPPVSLIFTKSAVCDNCDVKVK